MLSIFRDWFMIHTLCAIFFIGASHCPNFSDWFMIHCVLYFSLVLHTIPISVIDSWYIVSYLFPWCFTLSQFQWLIHDTLCAIFFLGASHCPNFRDWFMIHCLLCFSSGLHTVPISMRISRNNKLLSSTMTKLGEKWVNEWNNVVYIVE